MENESDVETLRRENAELREKLAKATAEAERYRASTNELLDTIFPYEPLTQEELDEMFKPEEGETFDEILAKYSRELTDKRNAS